MGMVIIEVIVVICAVLVIGISVNVIEDYHNRTSSISFKEAMDLANLPVITFYQGDKKFNFLLDTGSNFSHICKSVANQIDGVKLTGEVMVHGVGGAGNIGDAVKTTLSYKDKSFDIVLCIGSHLDETFNAIKASTGVTVHGILGSIFLEENKYVLDFAKLVAYSKK